MTRTSTLGAGLALLALVPVIAFFLVRNESVVVLSGISVIVIALSLSKLLGSAEADHHDNGRAE